VSAASFAPLTPIAPGAIVSIFGERLAERSSTSTDFPLPADLAGTQVLLAGRQIPLLYADEGQVNAMIPYDVAVNTQHQIVVRRGTSATTPEPVTVAPAAPAVFSTDGTGKGQGHVYIARSGTEQVLADGGNPARAGDVLVIYCAGLGATDPPVAAGMPARADPLAHTATPITLRIGGVEAEVFFAGPTPGFTGLYQGNAFLPPGVAPGDAVPVVITVAGQVSPEVTMAVR